MKAFQFAPGLDLRVIEHEGGPGFLAADVCAVLDLKPDPTNGSLQNHIRRLDPDEWTTLLLPAPSGKGTRKQYVLSESGMYVMVLRSKKPEAKTFRKWVTSEVLPSIRKNGGYMAPAVAKLAVESPAEFMARALVMANETIAGLQKAAKGLEEETPPEDEKALMNEWLDQVGLGKLSQSDRIKLGQRSRTMGSRSPRSARC